MSKLGLMSKLSNFPLKPLQVRHTGWKDATPEKLNTEVVVAKAGTAVTCPQCGTLIGRLFSDLYSGVSCRAEQIEFAPGQQRHPHEKCECKRCGAGYMKLSVRVRHGTRIILHTQLGWI